MRALIKTAISYGLHNIPVKICTMIRDNETALSNACPKCQGDIGYKNYCKGCGEQPAYADMLKAYKLTADQKVVFTKEQLDNLKEAEKSIQVLGTVAKYELDFRLINSGYYVLPDEKLAKAWAILYNALSQIDEAVIVSFAIRGKERLGALLVKDSQMVLLGMGYGEQIVKVDEEVTTKVSEQEIDLGVQFVKSLKRINPLEIKNTFKEKLEQLISGQIPIQTQTKQPKSETAFFETAVQKTLEVS